MEQKRHIIEQTMQMFVRQGIKSVRMDDIARSLGLSKRTLYELFGSKEELLTLSILRFFENRRLRNGELTAGAANVLEALQLALNEISDSLAVANRMLYNLRKFYPAVYEKVIREVRGENDRCLRSMLEKGIADGLFIADFNLDLAISVLCLTSSELMSRGTEIVPAGMTEREAFAQIIGNFFRGIATRKGLELMEEYGHRREPSGTETRSTINEH